MGEALTELGLWDGCLSYCGDGIYINENILKATESVEIQYILSHNFNLIFGIQKNQDTQVMI